jgi:hypothetical protein
MLLFASGAVFPVFGTFNERLYSLFMFAFHEAFVQQWMPRDWA